MGIKMLYKWQRSKRQYIQKTSNKVADRNPTFPLITLNVSNQKAEIAKMNLKTKLTIFSL